MKLLFINRVILSTAVVISFICLGSSVMAQTQYPRILPDLISCGQAAKRPQGVSAILYII